MNKAQHLHALKNDLKLNLIESIRGVFRTLSNIYDVFAKIVNSCSYKFLTQHVYHGCVAGFLIYFCVNMCVCASILTRHYLKTETVLKQLLETFFTKTLSLYSNGTCCQSAAVFLYILIPTRILV